MFGTQSAAGGTGGGKGNRAEGSKPFGGNAVGGLVIVERTGVIIETAAIKQSYTVVGVALDLFAVNDIGSVFHAGASVISMQDEIGNILWVRREQGGWMDQRRITLEMLNEGSPGFAHTCARLDVGVLCSGFECLP